MNQLLIFGLLFIAAAQAVPKTLSINAELNEEWTAYKLQYGKKYDTLTELSRRLIWEQNVKYIQKHNLEQDMGRHTYTLGVNQFADMTNEEFRAIYLSTVKPKFNATHRFLPPLNQGPLPTTVDWRTKGYVTPVKNQGQCGSCWAFSTTGSLEGQHFRSTSNLVSFSEQQLVDCSGDYGNNGCEGGLMDNAFEYIKKFGIESEATYGYTAQDGNCHYSKSKVVASVTGYVDVKHGNEEDLAKAVASAGPVSVAIDASHQSFQLYHSGVYSEPGCSSTALDHGVLAVGYGTLNGKSYWLVKNSWGPGWGMSGYIMMTRDEQNQCGIATQASYPLV